MILNRKESLKMEEKFTSTFFLKIWGQSLEIVILTFQYFMKENSILSSWAHIVFFLEDYLWQERLAILKRSYSNLMVILKQSFVTHKLDLLLFRIMTTSYCLHVNFLVSKVMAFTISYRINKSYRSYGILWYEIKVNLKTYINFVVKQSKI